MLSFVEGLLRPDSAEDMDASVKQTERTMKAARPGRIIVVRHGRPTLNRNEGPRLDWKAYRDWWARYEQSPLAEGQTCAEQLFKEIPDDAVMFSSVRPRAMQTADHLARGKKVGGSMPSAAQSSV